MSSKVQKMLYVLEKETPGMWAIMLFCRLLLLAVLANPTAL
jgi:hypothetical protein